MKRQLRYYSALGSHCKKGKVREMGRANGKSKREREVSETMSDDLLLSSYIYVCMHVNTGFRVPTRIDRSGHSNVSGCALDTKKTLISPLLL